LISFQEINARSEILKKERELQKARGHLEKLHQRKYQTDSETEHSGYVFKTLYVSTVVMNVYISYNQGMSHLDMKIILQVKLTAIHQLMVVKQVEIDFNIISSNKSSTW